MQKVINVRCYSTTCNYVSFSFSRTRINGMTIYRASVIPVKINEPINGIVCTEFVPSTGYSATVGSSKRASNTALAQTRKELEVFINEAAQALENNGFTLAPFDAFDIAQTIECEVR